jgi:hypothetical protein
MIEISAVPRLLGVIVIYSRVIDDLCIIEIHHPVPVQHLIHHLQRRRKML